MNTLLRTSIGLICGSVALFVAATGLGQDGETCSTPGAAFDDVAPYVDTLDFATDLTIETIQVSNDIAHTFINDLTIEVESPTGTSFVLFDRSGGSADDVIVTWSDAGVSHGTDDFDCGCFMLPDGDLDLGDAFADESSLGLWTLTVTDNFAGDDGVVEEWCVGVFEPCPVLAPTGVTCTTVAGSPELSWTNAQSYDEIQVRRDGVQVASIGGSETTYTDLDMLLVGSYEYTLVGVALVDLCGSESEACTALVGFTETCVAGPTNISDTLGDTVVTITVPTDNGAQEAELELGITHGALTELTIDLEFGGTTVTLHDAAGGSEGIALAFRDFGVTYDSEAFDCGCAMQPSGPGTLADLVTGPVDGDWTLTITDGLAGNDGTFDSACLRLFEEATVLLPMFIRGDADGNGAFAGLFDALYVLSFQFVSGPAPQCMEAADADNNGSVSGLLDGLYMLEVQFTGGLPPEAPFPDCGTIDASDTVDLGCDVEPCP